MNYNRQISTWYHLLLVKPISLGNLYFIKNLNRPNFRQYVCMYVIFFLYNIL